MIGYSTNLDWRGGPDHGWRVELLKDGERVACMSLDEWKSLGPGRCSRIALSNWKPGLHPRVACSSST